MSYKTCKAVKKRSLATQPQNWLLPSHIALKIVNFVPVKFWLRISEISRFWYKNVQLAFADLRDVDSTKFFTVFERQRRCRPSLIQERLVEFLQFLGRNCPAIEFLTLKNRVDLRANPNLRFPTGNEFTGWRNIRFHNFYSINKLEKSF